MIGRSWPKTKDVLTRLGNASLTIQIWVFSLAFLTFEIVDEILKFDDSNKGFFEFFAVTGVILFILLCKACLFFVGLGIKSWSVTI